MGKEHRHRLPAKMEAYQGQVFDEDGCYVGFQCPNECDDCPGSWFDGMEITDAVKAMGGVLEFAHHDATRFSALGMTLAELGVLMCGDCHTLEHADDPSASRLPWD